MAANLEWRPHLNCRINSFDGFIWGTARDKKKLSWRRVGPLLGITALLLLPSLVFAGKQVHALLSFLRPCQYKQVMQRKNWKVSLWAKVK